MVVQWHGLGTREFIGLPVAEPELPAMNCPFWKSIGFLGPCGLPATNMTGSASSLGVCGCVKPPSSAGKWQPKGELILFERMLLFPRIPHRKPWIQA